MIDEYRSIFEEMYERVFRDGEDLFSVIEEYLPNFERTKRKRLIDNFIIYTRNIN